jgi:hypothetical protein
VSSIFDKNKQKSSVSQKMKVNYHIFAVSHWTIRPSLLLADGLISQICHHTRLIGTFAQWLSVLFLDTSQQLSIPFTNFTDAIQIVFKSISQQLFAKTWQFLSLFSETSQVGLHF